MTAFARRGLIALAAAGALGTTILAPRSAPAAPSTASCSGAPSAALAGVADGLSSTWGEGAHPENRRVLRSALASERVLRACGDGRAAISAELIAADAYGDVDPNRPALRCGALRDARARSIAGGDTTRAALVATALAGCGRAVAPRSSTGSAAAVAASLSTPAGAFAAIADGLSSTAGAGPHPEDAATLRAALASAAALRHAGRLADAASAELIAADAYSDVEPNAPAKRCRALADARLTLRALGQDARVSLVDRTIAASPSCSRRSSAADAKIGS